MKHTKHEECPFMCLSKDLTLEILFRLPLKSIGRCATVCKTLNSLISDPEFAMAHLEFSSEASPPLTMASQQHNIISKLELKDKFDITKGARLVELENQFPATECGDYYCFLIGSCNGLVCIYLKMKTKSRINVDLMFIWNPVTNEREEIELPYESGKTYLHEDACWFGYLPSKDEYKIFLSYSVGFKDRIYLYSFGTSSWKVISGSGFGFGYDNVFFDEALYWLDGRSWVCKFDLVKESFEKMASPIGEFDLSKNKFIQTSLGTIGEDCLCVVLVQHTTSGNEDDSDVETGEDDSDEEYDSDEEDEEEEEKPSLEVWMLEGDDKLNYSWKKWCSIVLQERIYRNPKKVLGFTSTGCVCFQEEYGLRLIDPMDDPPSYAIATSYNWTKVYNVCDYVESLLSPFDLP